MAFKQMSDVARAVQLGRDLFTEEQRALAGLNTPPARPAIPFRAQRALLSHEDEEQLLFLAKTKTRLSPQALETYAFLLAKMRRSEQYQGPRFMLLFNNRQRQLYREVMATATYRKSKTWELYLAMLDNLRRGSDIIDADRDQLAQEIGVKPDDVSRMASQLMEGGGLPSGPAIGRARDRKTMIYRLLPRRWDGEDEPDYMVWAGDMGTRAKALVSWQREQEGRDEARAYHGEQAALQ